MRLRPDSATARQNLLPRRPWQRRDRWRLWMLIVCLGLVFAAMRQLQEPQTVKRLDQLFAGQQQLDVQVRTEQSSGRENTLQIESHLLADSVAVTVKESVPTGSDSMSDSIVGLDLVQDNTAFRTAESEAWFGLFARLKELPVVQLAQMSVGQVSYAQLLRQPAEYRGHVVTLRGRVLREERQQPAGNDLGIDSYHRLWLQPQGGGQWPFVVYCLELPKGFPHGDQQRSSVTVTGFFFKNWSYSYDEGMGLAPVVLANSLEWNKRVARRMRQPISLQSWTWGIFGVGFFAVAVAWLVFHNTRRRPTAPHKTEQFSPPDESDVQGTVEEQLARLAEEEGDA